MPLRTQKPCYRIDKKGDLLIVTAYPAVGGRRVFGGQIKVPKHDKKAFDEQVLEFVTETKRRFGNQEK